MKKMYLLLLATAMLLPAGIKAQGGFTVKLQESFESGQIPSTWSQEYVEGEQSWQVESLTDYAYPANKIPDYKLDGGGTHRAYLRNTSGQTIGYKTKLVTPSMDLTGVYRPILRFYHAQDKWTSDVDTLSVYYRTDPEEDWLLLESYSKAYRNWQSETIELPNFNSKNYQLAFEGTDNMGRGIVLDSIVVRSYPECTLPTEITLTGVANGQATVSWHASWDADQFHVVLTNKKAEMDTLGLIEPAIIAFDTIMEYDGNFSVTATGLKANTTYYVYVQSICGGQNSEWSAPQEFTMAFRETLPYTETFQMLYTTNSISAMQKESWTWGGNYAPAINLFIGESYYYIYSHLTPADPAVMFNGNYTYSNGRVTTAIPANGLSYMATPELVGEDLKDCQVRFWATMARRHNRKNANAIIVAVATDASDYTTFVPVDTIVIEKKDVIEEYTVSLEKYTGDGKFVVFASYFDKPNQFYIDEVTIEKRPEFAQPDYQTFHIIPDSTSAALSWTAPKADVQSYNLIVSKVLGEQVADGIRFTSLGEPIVPQKVYEGTSNTASATLSQLGPWDKYGYEVIVQAVYAGGKSAWSQPRQFFTSAAMTLPMHFGFEDSEGYYTLGGVASMMYPDNIMIYSTDDESPHNTASTTTLLKKEGEKFLYLNMDAGKNTYIVFPKVDDVTKAQINFFLCSQTTANKLRCNIELGVMTEPADIHTFVKVAEYKASERWARCYGNFIDYEGTGQFIAMRWMEPAGQNYSTNYIDDVTISELVDCPMASGIDFVTTDSSAVISWDKGVATGWNVKVSSVAFDDAELTINNTLVGDIFNGYVETPSVTVNGLNYSKPYFVYVQAVCDGSLTEWTSAFKFLTDCKSVFSLPYAQYFNGDSEGITGSGTRPVCWTWGGYNNPYLYTSYDSDGLSPETKACLYLRTNNASEIGWVAMPEFDVPIQDVMLLYDYMSSTPLNATAIYVGLMSDPDDFSTFEVIDSVIPVKTSTWHNDIKVNFLNYKGDGKYIAFTCGPLRGNTYVLSYLDNVRAYPIQCQAPEVYVSDITSESFDVNWIGKLDVASEGWQYAIATKELTDLELSQVSDLDSTAVLATGITKEDSVYVDGLSKQTTYHVYVRGLCGDSVWTYITAMTECATIPANGRYVEDFESFGRTVTATLSSTTTYGNYFKKAHVPECWTVGTYLNTTKGFDIDPETNSTTYTIRNYYPFVFSNGSYSTNENNYYDKGTALTTYHYSNSGSNGLKLYGTYSATASSNHSPSWVAMPRVEAESDDQFRQLVVKGSFQMPTTAAQRLIIGVMDDPTDLSTFTVLDSIGPGLGTGVGKDIPFEVSLENYTGTGRYIAFRTPYGITTTVYLDDIVIDGTNCYQPLSSISRLTDKSVRLTAGLRGQTDWMYVLTDKPASDEIITPDGVNPLTKELEYDVISHIDTLWKDTVIEGSQTKVVERLDTVYTKEKVTVLTADTTIRVYAYEVMPSTARFKALTGLSASTTYYVAVGALCDPSSNLYSQFAKIDFTTLCSPVASLSEDFEDFETGSGKQVGCWITGSITPSATNTYIPYVYNTASYRSYGDKYLYLYSTTTYQGAYAISPAIDVEDITKMQVVFYARSATSAAYAKKLKVGIVSDPLNLSTMVILDTVDISTTGGRYMVKFDSYKGDLDGNIGRHLVFYSDFNATNQIGVGKVDIVPIPECEIPSKFHVDSLGSNDVTLSWAGNSAKYRLVLTSEAVADTTLNKGGNISSLVVDTIVSGNVITLDKLKSATEYFGHVAGICGTDTTDFDYGGVSFRTECPAAMPLPYSIDMEGMPSGTSQRPLCWMGNYSLATSNSYPYVYSSATYAHSGSLSVYMYGSADNTTVLVSPEWDVESLSELQVSFWARGSAKDKDLYIGIVPDSIVALGETVEMNNWFIPLSSITTDATYSTHKLYTFNLGDWDWEALAEAGLAGTKRFAIMTGSGTFYLDDIEVKLTPSCFAPSELKADSSTLTTINLHFIPGKKTDTNWEVALWDSEKDNPDTIYQVVDTFDCVLTGLQNSTIYNIAVRTLCANNEKSDWSYPTQGYTQFEIDTYEWNFSGSEAAILVEGSSSYYLHPALTPGSNNATDSYLYKAQRYLNTGTANNGQYVYGVEPTYTYGDNTKTDGALRLYTISSTDTAYVLLPAIKNASSKQITFDLRSAYAYSPDYPATSTYDYHSQIYYSYRPEVIVGTFDEGAGLESFKKLYSIRSPYYRNVNYDPVYPDPSNTTDKHGEYALPENNFLFDRITIPLEDDLVGKKLAIMSVYSRTKNAETSNSTYIDNLKVENKSQVATPQIKSLSVTDTTITINWDANGGAAWDILVFDSLAHFSDTLKSYFVKKIENITTTSYVVTGLKEKTSYYVYLCEAGKAQLGSVSTRVQVRTACTPLSENTVFDFDDVDDVFIYRYSSTDYQYPNECWSYGLGDKVLNGTYYTYFPRVRFNTSTYRYSRSGDGVEGASLQFYTSSSYTDAYAVMPYMTLENLDDKELVFWVRDGYENLSTHKMSVSNAITYDNSLVIGMVSDPEDFFGTFTPIDTLHYSYGPDVLTSSTLSSSDPTGEKWWEKKVVPLKSGLGGYVAFYKPGYHAGEYIDDISFQVRQTALAPTNLKTVVDTTNAMATWYAKQPGTSYIIQLSSEKDFKTLLVDSTITSGVFKFTGLTPDSHYFWRIRQIGTPYGDTGFSDADFWTECTPHYGTLITSFERDGEPTENYRNYSSTLLKNSCWIYDNAGTSSTLGTNYPYNIPSTTTVSYALTGDYALKLYATSTTFSGYVTTPLIENVDFDTLQVTFWMTPCPHGLTSNTSYPNQVSTAWAAANAAQVEVGTCSDVYDLETYVPIDTVKYSRYTVDQLPLRATASVGNDYTYQKFTLPLSGAVGKHVYLRAVFDKLPNIGKTTATTQSTIYIDNFSVEPLQVCATPQNLSAADITDVDAELSWSAGEDVQSYTVQVSKSYLFDDEDILIDTTLTDTKVSISGLLPATVYFARLRMTCVENGVGDWAQSISFRTAEAPLYYEQFTEATQLVDGWMFTTGLAKNVFAGADFTEIKTSVPGSTAGWYSANTNEALSGAHYAGRTYSTTAKWWMISPTILLNMTDTALLSFKLNYVLYNSDWSNDKTWRAIYHSDANGVGLSGYDDQFMVVISDDGGKTWKRENATIWNNETTNDNKSENYFYGIGDYSLNGIKFLGNNVSDDDWIRIDLAKYQGKAIKIGFYIESTKNNTSNVIHIDDIHVNYVTTITEENNICQFEDYNSVMINEDGESLFIVDGDNLSAGLLEKSAYRKSVVRGINDTILSLKLNVTEAPQVVLPSDTICEGETFSGYEFKPVSKQGLYKKKMVSAITGCDSIASFYLHVTPRVYANAEDTICQGQTYDFNGTPLKRSGLYTDTLTSFVTGCDSVINFVLFVRQPQGTTEQVRLCHGANYLFGDTVISTSGIYTRTFTTATGCDSVATIDVTVLPVLTDTIYDYFCQGSTYKQNGFDVSSPGLYRQTVTSVDGCDSTVVLILEHYSSDTTRVEFTITTDELPYQYESIVYGVGTQPGTYMDTILVKGDGCDAIVIHTLHINLPEGLDNISGADLHIAPSVIGIGESVSVVGRFTNQQMQDMVVDIYDMTGKRLSTLRPSIQPIVIGGFYQTGIYNIRVTAGDNTTYNGRVIVK